MQGRGEYLTKEKFEELSQELDHLKKVRRREVAESLEYAKSLGDLAENAEYHEARGAQAALEDRIMRLEAMLKSAVIMAEKHGDVVGVGSTVTVRRAGTKENITYKLVGSEESDIAAGKLSIHSPLGDALMDKKKGETFTFLTPKGKAEYAVVEIE
ncbi:MAG: transcription elongation factor GreA [Candidatus Taylorbacteria bacterium]|nr:transcription elongation factor GreA [Candidatus Taylorbacteria bacterium]